MVATVNSGSVMVEDRSQTPPVYGALAGLVAGGVAVTTGMLVAGILDVVSPIDAVGREFTDPGPPWLKDLATRWFGTNDKLALRTGIVVVLGIAALIVGYLATRWKLAGVIGIGAFGLIGAVAAWHRPGASIGAALPSVIGAAVGIPLLNWLVHPTRPQDIERPTRSRVPLGWDRRRFLVSTGTAAAGALVAGGIAQVLESRRIESIRDAIPDSLPTAAASSGSGVQVPADATLSPTTPFITPAGEFYRIDTALSFPRINLS